MAWKVRRQPGSAEAVRFARAREPCAPPVRDQGEGGADRGALPAGLPPRLCGGQPAGDRPGSDGALAGPLRLVVGSPRLVPGGVRGGGDRLRQRSLSRLPLRARPDDQGRHDLRRVRRAQRPGNANGDSRPRRPPILAPGETYYIYGKSYLFEAFPELQKDVAPPDCLGTTPVSTTSTWISSQGCVTPLHYDLPNTLLCQVRGSKAVHLFDPAQYDRLYLRGERFPGFDNFERQSRVDIHHPDFAAFPEFRRAVALEVTLRQGEALFIPSNWFHEVETLEPSISVGFTFAGGTTTSELAILSDLFKQIGEGRRSPGWISSTAPGARPLRRQLPGAPGAREARGARGPRRPRR